jgi:hypothetical protein
LHETGTAVRIILKLILKKCDGRFSWFTMRPGDGLL